jgi:hypothetical protein
MSCRSLSLANAPGRIFCIDAPGSETITVLGQGRSSAGVQITANAAAHLALPP